MKISVIVPTLNAAGHIEQCLRPLGGKTDELIVVDGGSTDGTVGLAIEGGARVITAPKGRGPQQNAGTHTACGDVLVFLHADTRLPVHALDLARAIFLHDEVQVCKFMLDFDHPHWLLSVYSWMTRFDSLWTSFGDQGLMVRRAFFEKMGGFRDWPLFEDVDFFRRARRQTKVRTLPLYVTTSAQKFKKNGIIGQQLKNGRLICRYLQGESPEKLARDYNS